jgi:signal peptide peptidase SppA
MSILAKFRNRSAQAWMIDSRAMPGIDAVLSLVDQAQAAGEAGAPAVLGGGVGSGLADLAVDGKPMAGMGVRSGVRSRQAFQLVGSVAVVDVWGVLDTSLADVSWWDYRWGTGYDEIMQGVAAAIADPNVKGTLVRVDSPGGNAIPVEGAALAMLGARFAASGKPLIAFVEGMAASASLYLASQADKVFVSPGAWVGSIGTIMHAWDYSQALAAEGYTVNTIKSHPLKDVGSAYRPMSETDRAVLQREVNAYDAGFLAALARGRGVSAEQVKSWQDAHAFIGAEAVAAGLADGVMNSAAEVIRAMNAGTLKVGGASGGGGSGKAKAEAVVVGVVGAVAGGGGGAGAVVIDAVNNGADARKGEDTMRTPRDLLMNAGLATGTAAGAAAGSGGGGEAGGAAGGVVNATAVQESLKADRGRTSTIMARALPYQADAQVIKLRDAAIENGLSADAFSAQVLDHLATNGKPATGHVPGGGTQAGVSATITEDARDKRMKASETALMIRASPDHTQKILAGDDGVARAYGYDNAAAGRADIQRARSSGFGARNLQLMVASCAVAAGLAASVEQVLGMIGDQRKFMAIAGHSSSDFPQITANVANKRLQAVFSEQAVVWDRVCRRGISTDYKERAIVALSEAPNIQELDEGDTPKEASFNERKQGITVKAQGIRFGMTYQMMRNDDLGAFSQALQLIGLSFRRMPDIALVKLLEQNSGLGPTMSDGATMFHATHNNILTQAALAYDALRTGYTAFREQKGFGPDAQPIEILPKVLLVRTNLELLAKDLVTQEKAPTSTSSAATQNNIMRGMLEAVASPRFSSTTRWWLFGEAGPFAALEAAFMDGVETPQVDRITDGDPMTIRYQATQLGFAVAAVNWEAAVTNAGQ